MAELEIIRKEWILQARLDENEAPDMAGEFGVTMRPERMSIFFAQDAKSGSPDFTGALVYGPIISSKCHVPAGMEWSEFISPDEMRDAPAWLLPRISLAQTIVFRDAGTGGF
jgi:hypothetical protein